MGGGSGYEQQEEERREEEEDLEDPGDIPAGEPTHTETQTL